MNIKQAKQEIMDTVQAYFMKDEYGEYVIPSIHQRPVLILGAPGIGKTQIMEQAAVYLIQLPIIPDRVPLDFLLFQRRNMGDGNILPQSIP